MRLRTLYALAGLAWAALLGPLAGLALFGAAAGVAWLLLYGDNPWPRATEWALPAIAFGGGLAVAGMCVLIAYVYGRARESTLSANRRTEQWKATALIIAAAGVMLVLGAKYWADLREYEAAMAKATAREIAFAQLAGTRHSIAGIDIARSGDGAISATIRLSGERAGSYRLRWHVQGMSFGAPLLAAQRLLQLSAGSHAVAVSFSVEDLAREYRALVLHGRGGILVEEPFRVVAQLEPVLTEADWADLPPGERHRFESGESTLRARASASFPVRFVIAHNP